MMSNKPLDIQFDIPHWDEVDYYYCLPQIKKPWPRASQDGRYCGYINGKKIINSYYKAGELIEEKE